MNGITSYMGFFQAASLAMAILHRSMVKENSTSFTINNVMAIVVLGVAPHNNP